MVKLRGGGPMNLEAVDEERLRTDIESVAAGKTDLTDDQLADLLLSAFPLSYPSCNRKLLIKRVAKIQPLPCRGNDAVEEEPSNKRRKLDENGNAGGGVELLSSPVVPVTSSEPDQSKNDEVGDGRRENLNGDGGSGSTPLNRPTSRESEGRRISGGDGRREFNCSNGGGRWRTDVRANNRPLFRDLEGMDKVLLELKREAFALHQSKVLRRLGVEPTARILLHGPRGCGKTTLARALANEAGVPFYEISALVAGVSDAQEEYVQELLSAAYMRAPSIVFIDDVDAMASKTVGLPKEIEPCMVNLLMDCLDGPVNHEADIECSNSSRPGQVLLIVATNRPDAIDPGLRRRFDREIFVDAPDEIDRYHILSRLARNLRVEHGLDLTQISICTLGFAISDLVALAKMAGMHAVNRIVQERMTYEHEEVLVEDRYTRRICEEELEDLCITMEDFVGAAMKIHPSSKIECFHTVPNAKWDDVGGLELLKLEFERHVIKPIKFPEVYKHPLYLPTRNFYYGPSGCGKKKIVKAVAAGEEYNYIRFDDPSRGLATTFFLYGPSGCGKTLIVEALANEAGANLLHIKARDLMVYGGQSKLVVQIIFNYAIIHSPCIIFFDELDAITPYKEDEKRWPDFRELVSEVHKRTRKLKYMSAVYVIGATNRREIVNHFSLIQSYFDKTMYVPRPSPEERGKILKALARDKPIHADVDFLAIGKDVACGKFSCADLAALMKEATAASIDRPSSFDGDRRLPWTIKDEHFRKALKKVSPSLLNRVLCEISERLGAEAQEENCPWVEEGQQVRLGGWKTSIRRF